MPDDRAEHILDPAAVKPVVHAALNGSANGKPDFDPAVARLIAAEQAIRLRAVPTRVSGGRLHVAMLDAADFAADHWVERQ